MQCRCNLRYKNPNLRIRNGVGALTKKKSTNDGGSSLNRVFHKSVTENKDISKLFVQISGSLNDRRQIFYETLDEYYKFKEIWTENSEEKCQVS